MDPPMSSQERQLCQLLVTLPSQYRYRYSDRAQRELLDGLFWTMARGKAENMRLFFPPGSDMSTRLSDAQGAVEGAEYTEAARGKRCGHIFKAGEASYACRTCSTDDTCVLCSRCFDSTDHAGHMVRINISVGNSGCCDCGDPEAWKVPMKCTIHSKLDGPSAQEKGKETSNVPQEVVQSTKMTVARVLDFICDVVSCCPEQLRQVKTKESIIEDERASRLSPESYGMPEPLEEEPEFALLLWNDEKHTITDVQHQVGRMCSIKESQAYQRAIETDTIGRSIIRYMSDVDTLLTMANKLEQIRLTMTVRSSRDTFREQMCATMVDWLSDIAGCSVGNDNTLLRDIVCQELLKPWREGSSAAHASVGRAGIDDEAMIEFELERERHHQRHFFLNIQQLATRRPARVQTAQTQEQVDNLVQNNFRDDESDDDIDRIFGFDRGDETPSVGEQEEEDDDDDVMMVDARPDPTGEEAGRGEQIAVEEDGATIAGYPPPPPSASGAARRAGRGEREASPSDSETAEQQLLAPSLYAKANVDVPKTPGKPSKSKPPRPGRYWLEAPAGYRATDGVPPEEDVFQRVRLDWLILFDLRLWKRVRNDLRSLYISTVVQVPRFKRILGLRFASLYTILAQLYLIGDREPDHSIINLSLQMFTTPSITAELVERGNFLTSLLAILYTFLTTRQVGHPWDVDPKAVLAFDSGSVTNRRMYHFYMDLKYLFSSPHVQERIRVEHRYLMQFLDLVKLHQGIGPNVRATGQHVEFETDSWITASLVTREINRMSRQLSDAFRNCPPEHYADLSAAIRAAAKVVILNSIGADRGRFKQAEIKDEVRFKTLQDFEFDVTDSKYRVVKFIVEEDPISFHHALHYTLSWLIECGKSFTADDIASLLTFTTHELWAKPRSMGNKIMSKQEYTPEDYLMAAFDYPLRVCACLAQIKAGMWVRNGISLRHQAATYRGVNQRDISHHRDIFLLQTAMVVCNPNRVLTSIIDRFGMESWVKGIFEQKSEVQDDAQHLDVVEDMLHLLIVLLSDRTALIPPEDEPNQTLLSIRRDLVHVLCFKPLSFNEISNKMPDKYQEQEDFQQVLDQMAIFKAPEGVSDVGTFELRPEYVEEVDPYIAHYNKNQREEAEMVYRKKIANRTGQNVDDVVYEPKLRPIPSGVFKNVGAFTSSGMFAQVIYYSLLYPLVATKLTPEVPSTRVETFLQVVLHLILIAIAEDTTDDNTMAEETPASFIHIALTRPGRSNFIPESPNAKTIVALLDLMSTKDEFKACHKKLILILKRMKQKRPWTFEQAYTALGIPVDRVNTSSPAINSAEAEKERKKKAALSRQAKVMAQFQQQQKSFMENQGDIDWGAVSDGEEGEEAMGAEERKNLWKYPSGTCILCQEETDDGRLSGTFALFNHSRIVRRTDLKDPDFVREAFHTPCNLDRSAEDIRPFGVAHENRKVVTKISQTGETIQEERQTIGRGFPASLTSLGTASVGCGHLMHFSCFETYYEATQRRQAAQIARHHPENLKRNEFVCPLCKALGNAFLPVMWKPKEESYPGEVQPNAEFTDFLDGELPLDYEYVDKALWDKDDVLSVFTSHATSTMVGGIAEKAPELIKESWTNPSGTTHTVTIGTGLGSQTIPIHESNIRDSLANHPGMVGELAKVYQRLRETMRVNGLSAGAERPRNWLVDSAKHVEVLIDAVGYTISSVEIQHRGVESEDGMTLIDKIPEQALTHLRILADTAQSYLALAGLGSRGESHTQNDFDADCKRLHSQLFTAQAYGHPNSADTDIPLPLLSQDVFLFMCGISFTVVPVRKLQIHHVLRLCYLAELVKVVHHMSIHVPVDQWIEPLMNHEESDRGMRAFAEFALRLTEWGMDGNVSGAMGLHTGNSADLNAFNQPNLQTLSGYYTFARKYALTFLRKSAILLNVKYGVDLSCAVPSNPDADELDRLSEVLRLPSFGAMCLSLTDVSATANWPETIKDVARGWIQHHIHWLHGRHPDDDVPTSAALTHPGIFELVGLPKNFDALIEESTRRRCPSSGKDLSDPMICLLCGEMFCGQSMCCLKQERLPGETDKESIGGAQQHMRKCQFNVGLFLNIRKCCTFYLFRRSGSWSAAPYIDRYGETDMGLRHSRQLFLHQKRYDSTLRATFLAHGIPSFISRKLEGEINNGGWETI